LGGSSLASVATGHRRFIYTLAGKARIPGRYAIDFVGVDELGRTTHGNSDFPPDAIGYGARVLAGADANVAAVRDGIAESSSIRGNSAHALGEGAGNYVALKLSGGRYVYYEHLKLGSIRVKVDEHVHLGDVIGNVGFSGDTTRPHLHVHVADGVDPLASEGLPFVVESYKEIGRYSNFGDLGQRKWESNGTPSGQNKSREWPGANVVLEFNH
jgi:murein DD-endopeptidase MepM/ murein hydrolase activator NlpD